MVGRMAAASMKLAVANAAAKAAQVAQEAAEAELGKVQEEASDLGYPTGTRRAAGAP